MKYEYNISYRGEHFLFAGSRNNITRKDALDILKMLRQKFAKEDGYYVNCSCTSTETTYIGG